MKSRKNKKTIPMACAVGVIVSMVVLAATVFVSAVLLHSEKVSTTYMSVIRIFTLYIGATAGVLSASIYLDERRGVTAVITGAIIAILQMVVALAIYKRLTGSFFLNVVLLALSVITAILLSRKRKQNPRKRVRSHSV